jgi:integrase
VAHIVKRGERWRAEVCVERKRRAKTFGTKREAIAWANGQEEDGILAQHSFRDALKKYKPIAEGHKGSQAEVSRLKSLEAVDWIDTPLERITASMITAWRDKRLGQVAPVSVRREMIIMGAMFKLAVREWGWLRDSPLSKVTKPRPGPARQRGVSDQEITDMQAALGKMAAGPQVFALFALSIETGMRLSEMLSLRWVDVTEKAVRLRQTKNGEARTVPLSPKAREIIEARRGIDPDDVFTVAANVASHSFGRARDTTPHKTLHFHDARSEAITRLSKRLDVLQLARMIGHRDLKSLMIYYAETPEAIADRLG